jgi:hypothetical protein
MIMHRNNIEKRTDLSAFRIEFVEGWYVKYADVEQIPGQDSLNNTVPHSNKDIL